MASINYLTTLDDFLVRWDQPASLTASGRRVRGPAGGGAPVYARHHPRFHESLEAGVRPLVLALVEHFDCVTYSSCEGHPASRRRVMRPLHVGVVGRTAAEHARLREQLQSLIRRVQSRTFVRGASVRVEVGKLDSESGPRPCVDLVLDATGSERAYFAALPRLTRALIREVTALAAAPGGETATPAALTYPGATASLASTRLGHLRRCYEKALPYPHLVIAQLLSQHEARTLRDAISAEAWRRVEREAYQFDVVDLLRDFRRDPPFAPLLDVLSSAATRRALRNLTATPSLVLDSVHVHRMSRGDAVMVHSDGEGHSSAVRLVVYLDGRPSAAGGVHLFLRERVRDFVVEKALVPRAGHALLFPMGGAAFHAVTQITGARPRHTLIATYGPRDGDD